MGRISIFICLISFFFGTSFALSEPDFSSLADYQKVKTLSGYSGNVLSIAFSPNGKIMATGMTKEKIILWDVSNWKILATLAEKDGDASVLAFSHNGKILASGNHRNGVTLWDTASWTMMMQIKTSQPAKSFSFSSDDSLLAVATEVEKLLLWNISQNTISEKTITCDNAIKAVAFSPDGTRLATGDRNNKVIIWDAVTAKKVKELAGHINDVMAVTYSYDGKYLASGGDDNLVLLWDAKTGEVVDPLPGHKNKIRSLLFSPKSNLLVSSDHISHKGLFGVAVRDIFGGCKNIFWDVTTGKPLKMLYSDCSLSSAAFSPDAKYFIAGHAAGNQYISVYEKK